MAIKRNLEKCKYQFLNEFLSYSDKEIDESVIESIKNKGGKIAKFV